MSSDSLFQSSLCSRIVFCHSGLSCSAYNLSLLKTEQFVLFITFYIFKECYHPLQPLLLQSKHSKFLQHIFLLQIILSRPLIILPLCTFSDTLYIPSIRTLKTQHWLLVWSYHTEQTYFLDETYVYTSQNDIFLFPQLYEIVVSCRVCDVLQPSELFMKNCHPIC